ncbi:MAG TPA: hypothetical protein VMG35_14135 [Bryobacteraceae bacterium]|nr:hypothetical protein [Bryobacteraceae bacterium]
MTKRVLLAGLAGGVVMYIWIALAHMVLPLGEAGIKEIPNEPAVLSAMRSSLGDSAGLYLFPGMGLGPNATAPQKQAAAQQYGQKLAVNPSGILMYNPPGIQALQPRMFIAEFLKEVIEVLLAVTLLAQTRLATYASRLGFMAGVGVLASIGTNISYWNWYGFPVAYTAAYMTTQIVGYVCAGLVAAAMVKPARG